MKRIVAWFFCLIGIHRLYIEERDSVDCYWCGRRWRAHYDPCYGDIVRDAEVK